MVYGRYMRDIYILYLLWFINQLITGGHHLVQTSGQLEHGSERIAPLFSTVFLVVPGLFQDQKAIYFFGSESDIAILSMEWTPSSLSFTMFPKRFQEDKPCCRESPWKSIQFRWFGSGKNSTPIRHNCWPSEDKPSHESGKRRVPGFWGQDILPIVPKGSPTWCACNSKAELISSKEGCEATGGGRDQECEWFTWRVASAQPSPSSWNRDFFHSFQLRFC